MMVPVKIGIKSKQYGYFPEHVVKIVEGLMSVHDMEIIINQTVSMIRYVRNTMQAILT